MNEKTKAPTLKDIAYPVSIVDLDELLKRYANIPDIDPESEEAGEQYQMVLKGHKEFVKARTSIEKVRKELKQPALDYGKEVDDIAKEFQKKINPTETLLQIQRSKVEQYEQKKIAEAEEAERERVISIRNMIEDIRSLPLKHFTSTSNEIKAVIESLPTPNEVLYEEFIDDAVSAYTITMQQLESAYETKLKAEQADALEADRKAEADAKEVERQKEIYAERKALEDEKEELQREKDEMAETIRLQSEAINKQNAERELEEQQKQIEADRINKEQVEAIAKEEREKADIELFERRYGEAKLKLIINLGEAYEVNSILDAIINGDIPHVKWVPDEN